MKLKPILVLLVLILVLVGSGACNGSAGELPAAPTTVPEATPAPEVTTPQPTAEPVPETSPTATTPSELEPEPVSGAMTVYFFDVGQADATLLVGPDFTVLIDAGDYSRDDVVPHLRSAGVKKIDLLIGTHPHADHIGQFPQVLESFPVGEVWLSGDTATSRTFERALDAVLASGADYHEPRADEVFQFGSLRVEVLNPEHLSGDFHGDSISVRVVFGNVALVFTGDAEAPTEHEMIERGHNLRAQVLQLGHHGSRNSSSQEFLETVSPEVAIYSAGVGNDYGHPHQETIDRILAMGIDLFGTDVNGTIVVETDGVSYSVSTAKQGVIRGPPADGGTSSTGVTGSGCAPGQININSASIEELQQIVHIGPERAAEIIFLRPFASLDELEKVSGIGPGRLADIKEQGLACVGDSP